MNLSQFIEWLATNPKLNFTIAIIGLFLAIFFYIKGKKVKLPYYAIRSHNIVRDLVSRIDSLEMLYAGERIENLTATKIAFWNAGNDTIKREDIPDKAPLTVTVKKGYKILEAKILHFIEEANQFSIPISEDKSHISIYFEYLDKNQGVIIQLLHTGKSKQDIEINGKIKGFGIPKRKNATIVFNSGHLIFFVFCFGIPVYIIGMGVANGGIFEATIGEIIVIAFFFILFWGFGFLILSQILPKGFKKFEEEILS